MRLMVRRILGGFWAHMRRSRTYDDRRAIRETLASPIVAKTGESRFWGYAPLDYQSTGGL